MFHTQCLLSITLSFIQKRGESLNVRWKSKSKKTDDLTVQTSFALFGGRPWNEVESLGFFAAALIRNHYNKSIRNDSPRLGAANLISLLHQRPKNNNEVKYLSMLLFLGRLILNKLLLSFLFSPFFFVTKLVFNQKLSEAINMN